MNFKHAGPLIQTVLRPSSHQLPPEYREEYQRDRAPFVRARVASYCLAATLIYSVITLHYAFRQWITGMEVFRAEELPVLAFLIAGTSLARFLNRKTAAIGASKRCAHLYTVFLLTALTVYGLVYRDHAFLFVFYHGFALLLVALMIPWSLRETAALTLLYTGSFAAYLAVLVLGLGYPVLALPRFHPFLDGLVVMGIAGVISFVIRHNDIRHDYENFLLLKRIESQTRQFERELKLADRVHKTLIPESVQSENADIAVTYIPMNYVGGDYAKFRFLEDGRLVIFISDVTGHGVPAALLVNRVHAEFERLVREDATPGVLLKNLNRFISRDFEGTQMYLSAFCGLLDFKRLTFSFSNYGHPPQYLYRVSSGEVKGLHSHTSFLGMLFEETEYHEGRMDFELGDSFLLFTDGVLETTGPGGEFYGERRLRQFVVQSVSLPSLSFNEALIRDLKRFGGSRFNDDVFILNVKTKPSV